MEEQKAIRKPVILTKTMEDKNKNLKSGIVTELYPNTNKGILFINEINYLNYLFFLNYIFIYSFFIYFFLPLLFI